MPPASSRRTHPASFRVGGSEELPLVVRVHHQDVVRPGEAVGGDLRGDVPGEIGPPPGGDAGHGGMRVPADVPVVRTARAYSRSTQGCAAPRTRTTASATGDRRPATGDRRPATG